MDDLLPLLRAGASEQLSRRLGELAPAPSELAPLPLAVPRRAGRTGFDSLGPVLDARGCRALSESIDRLLSPQLPAAFLFLFDSPWALGARVAEQASRRAGGHYRLATDVWAWRISPGKSGWTPHRGVSWRLDRDRPEVLDTWVALSDVEVDRACMHFVPLDDDPAYPERLESIEVPVRKALAAPLAAGEALVWNANVLHWGGECAATARGPRVSCSFSLVREDAVEQVGIPLADPPPRTLEERLDLVARQIAIYGEGQPDVRPEVLEWARASVAMGAAVAKLSRDLSGT